MGIKLKMGLRKLNVTFLFLLVGVLSAWAEQQLTVTGKVVSKTNEKIEFATVHLKGTSYGAITNEKGVYSLQAPAGQYTLVVSLVGYETMERPVTLIHGKKVQMDVVIDEKSALLSEVVVMGNSKADQLKKKGFAVNMIQTNKLALQSIQATELLDRTAGVRIRQSGGVGSKIDYNINGLSGNSVRIFIDGIPMRNFGSSFSLSSIPTEQIERIEVYKGVVPTYLSEDALGGAINIVLKKRLSLNNLSASYSFGSFNTHRTHLNGGYRDNKTGLSVDASAHYNSTNNDYKVWGDQVYVTDPETWKLKSVTAKRFHDGYESYGVRANVGFTDVKWADNLILGLLYSDMNKDVQHGGTMEVVYGNRRTGQTTQMASLKYDKKNLFIRNLDLNSFVSYTHGNRWVVDTIPDMYYWNGERLWNQEKKEYYQWNKGGGEAGKATLANNLEKTIAGRANLSYALHRQHRLSLNYLYNRFSRDVEDPLLPQAEQRLTDTRYMTKQIVGLTYENHFFDERLKSSLFFKHYMQHVELSDPVKVGSEYTSQRFEKSVHHNGYGISLSYALLPKILLQASYERALRMPENDELLGNESENMNATYELEPEKSNNYNVGVLLGPFHFDRHEIRTDVNFFVRDIFDMIQRGKTSTDGYYGYENLGKVLSRGVDAEIGYNYNRKLFLTYNLSLFNALFNLRYDENGAEYAYYKNRLRNAPYFTMNAGAEYVFSDVLMKGANFTLNYHFSYVHEFFKNWESIGGANKAIIPTQHVHDIGAVYTFPQNKVTIGLTAKNILDQQIFDNWALQKPGRSFHAKISYKIF